jgi:hypothetical protein
LDGIEGLAAGDPVTAAQMRALLGCGLHPLAELRQRQLEGPDLTERDSADLERCRRQHEWEFLRPSRVPDRRPEEMLAGLWWYQAWSAAV